MAEQGFMGKAKNFVTDKVSNVAKPEAEVTDVDFKKVGLSNVEYLAKVSVTNPYSHSIPICDIKYTLKSVNREIASGTIPDPGSIKESDITVLEVLLKVPHSVLVTLAKDLGADWDFDYEEIASGTIPDPGSIKESDITVLEVLLKVPHSVLVTLAKDLGADWDFDYELDIGLTIDLPVIGNFTLPLNKKGEFKLPTLF